MTIILVNNSELCNMLSNKHMDQLIIFNSDISLKPGDSID